MFRACPCLLCLVGFLLLLEGSASETHFRCSAADDRKNRVVKMGVIADNSSRVGREQVVAIHMALKNYPPSSTSCHKLELLFLDSPDNSARAIATALDLITHKKVESIFGTLTREKVSSIFELHKASMNIPIISLSLSSFVPPPTIMPIQMSSFIQMANDITHQTRCTAAIVGQFRWRRVTALYENKNGDFTTKMAILKLLSDSLRDVNSEIENHHAFSLLDPEPVIDEKLMNLRNDSNRVFVLVQSSVELATLLFRKAKQLNMMENGYVWIVGDEMANLLDSLDSSAFSDLQGVIGCKIHFEETKNKFKKFKAKFRRNYMSKFSEDEGRGDPSIFALRAYDAYWAIAYALDELQGKRSGKQWPLKVLESKFEGVSGEVRFQNGILSQLPTFQIINVFGKGYKEIASWSPDKLGFFDKLSQQTSTNATTGNASFNFSNLVFWPGNARTVPKGWDFSNLKKPLRIGVPTTAAFKEFVRVNYNHEDGPQFSGFSISVFGAVASNLPYFLPYKFFPNNGSYDSLLQKVHNKEFDGAVGDFRIFADRFEYVDFSEPYLDNEAVMIVKEKPVKWGQWVFMRAFTPKMWLLMLSMHIFVSSAIWLVERKHNDALKGFGNMLWFSVSVIFYLHREPVKSGLARLVLGPWLFTILIVTASFTASLSSMMTISRYQPSFVDIETLKLKNATVGCNNGSVMVRFLSQVLLFPAENIRQIAPVDAFPMALENGEIQAAFFSGPHAKVFLAKYCKDTIKATTFKLLGMGFAFPKGSPLTVDVSKSITELIEERKMPDLKTTLLSTFNCSSKSNDDDIDGSGLGPEPFGGLLLISGVIASTAVLITACRLALMKLGWIRKPISSKSPNLQLN